jgi:PAS domain S-box-containing protein
MGIKPVQVRRDPFRDAQPVEPTLLRFAPLCTWGHTVINTPHQSPPPLSIGVRIGHFIKWKRTKRRTVLLHEAGYLLLGLVLLTTVTGLYFWLDVPPVSAAFTYLGVLVLLSLVSNFYSLIVLSFICVCCLDYFFAPPIYSFRIDYSLDLTTIAAFVITSFVVNFLLTKVRITNKALRESEYKLRQIIETVPGLIWSNGPDGEPTRVSQRMLDFSGMRFEDFKLHGWEAFVHPADFPETAKAFYHAIQAGTSYQGMMRLRRADGEFRWHHARCEPLRDREGRIVQWYGLSIDIDERKRAEQALREEHERLRQLESDLAHMNRLSIMGELAASLAHEITQPIATARNNARAAMNFLDRSTPNPGQVREALICVVNDADRAGDILDRMRDQIKKAPPRKDCVDVNQAITDVIALAQGAIIKNGVSIQTRLAEGLSRIQADRVQLQQVVLNLILNAVEAMGSIEQGVRELSITTKQQGAGGVLVAVHDSGPGIDPERPDRVFDAFYTTKSSGVGMGLSICRSIINAHGGRLWADANVPRGAIFQFTLPSAENKLVNVP